MPIGATDAKDYNVDTSRIVNGGESAEGHLAVTTGMIPGSAGLDRQVLASTSKNSARKFRKSPQS